MKYHCTLGDPTTQSLKLIGDFAVQHNPTEEPVLMTSDSVREKLRIPKPRIIQKLKKDKEKAEPLTSTEEEKEEEDGVYPIIKLYSITSGVNHILRGIRGEDENDRYKLFTDFFKHYRHLAINNFKKLIEAASMYGQ